MNHIVFVIGNYKNGGVARRATTLANEFAKVGYNCTILVTRELSKNVFFQTNENVEIIELSKYVSKNKRLPQSEKALKRKINILKKMQHITVGLKSLNIKISTRIKMLRSGMKLLPYISDHKDSLYISFGIYLLAAVHSATLGEKIKLIYSEINAPEVDLPAEKAARKEMIKIVADADCAIFQTESERDFFDGYLKKAFVINNPVKENLPAPYRGERRNIAVNYCRVAEQKNLKLLIDAFMLFTQTHSDYTLEIYGNTVIKDEEDLLNQLKDYVKSINAQQFIRFLEPRADIHNIVRDYAMFVSSSDFEGLSNSMIEALAIGLPCVCTDCLGGGAREMITDGENGLLVPMNDAVALAKAMNRMIDDKDLIHKCYLNADKIRIELCAEKITQKWLDVVNSTVKQG
ncbi:MAG: glycosyltransferase [Clostridia bacterium]|nr:glycosyltransferase [Clostridia bacterium]